MPDPSLSPYLLLTNDDGWNAPGLEALRSCVQNLGPCRVVAPAEPSSGCGHKVTTHQSIGFRIHDPHTTVVKGTPADCVRLGLEHFAPGPAWILSGINRGGNLGTDVYQSGTVAAVREGAIRGYRGIALSQYLAPGKRLDWTITARFAFLAVMRLLREPWEPGTYWNVNLPHLGPDDPEPNLVFCKLDPSPLPVHYRLEGSEALYSGDYQGRARIPGRDVDICFAGQIAITRLAVAADGNS